MVLFERRSESKSQLMMKENVRDGSQNVLKNVEIGISTTEEDFTYQQRDTSSLQSSWLEEISGFYDCVFAASLQQGIQQDISKIIPASLCFWSCGSEGGSWVGIVSGASQWIKKWFLVMICGHLN
jgi:hypothetical protein